MTANEARRVVAQLESLLAIDNVGSLVVEGCFGSYEVTVHEWASQNHGHFGGATLAEAVNRAALGWAGEAPRKEGGSDGR